MTLPLLPTLSAVQRAKIFSRSKTESLDMRTHRRESPPLSFTCVVKGFQCPRSRSLAWLPVTGASVCENMERRLSRGRKPTHTV